MGSVAADTVMISQLSPADNAAVLTIYQQGIETGHATFESAAPSWNEWDRSHLPICRLGAYLAGELIGWAALSPTSSRCVYAGVAEESVYVAANHLGSGIGKKLLDALIEDSEKAGIWTLTAGIFPENEASIALHEQAGFEIIGRRCKLGKMSYGPLSGKWRDVITMERRSSLEKFQ